MYKNINKQEKLELKNVVEYQEGQVVSKTLVQGRRFLPMQQAVMPW